MSQRKEVCDECGGSDIRQQITFMVDPNDVPKSIKLDGEEVWDDYYWCNNCEDECDADYEKIGAHVFKAASVVDDCSLCGWHYAHASHA